MSNNQEDQVFCIFCEDIRHEASGLMSVMGWLGPRILMGPTEPLSMSKLCAVISIYRTGLEPIKQLRIRLRMGEKDLHQIAPSKEVLSQIQADIIRESEGLGLKGLTVKLNMQMMFFKVDEPGTLCAFVEIDGKPEIEGQSLQFVRPIVPA